MKRLIRKAHKIEFYHGTPYLMDILESGVLKMQDGGAAANGIYLTDDYNYASGYAQEQDGAAIIAVDLDLDQEIKNGNIVVAEELLETYLDTILNNPEEYKNLMEKSYKKGWITNGPMDENGNMQFNSDLVAYSLTPEFYTQFDIEKVFDVDDNKDIVYLKDIPVSQFKFIKVMLNGKYILLDPMTVEALDEILNGSNDGDDGDEDNEFENYKSEALDFIKIIKNSKNNKDIIEELKDDYNEYIKQYNIYTSTFDNPNALIEYCNCLEKYIKGLEYSEENDSIIWNIFNGLASAKYL